MIEVFECTVCLDDVIVGEEERRLDSLEGRNTYTRVEPQQCRSCTTALNADKVTVS